MTVHTYPHARRSAARAQRVFRVASVPRGHVYVEHLSPSSGSDGVVRLPDPPPSVLDAVPGQWWPPTMLAAGWIHDHASDFDVFHVHFGFDALSPRDLRQTVEALRAAGRPLVYTVHDLRNPHHETRDRHDAHLDVLVPAADRVITLSAGAAAEIQRRWGRRALVVPHPHVAPLERADLPRAERSRYRVGLHLKSVRPNVAARAVVAALLPLVDELRDLQLVVDVHHDVADPRGVRHDTELMSTLRCAHRAGAIELHVHDWYTDDELWSYLESLDLSVLPYRFGTHSGWVEACHDLGTPVLVPSCGYLAEQSPELIYDHDESGLDAASLRSGVRIAYQRRSRTARDVPARRRQRDAIADAHRRIYASVLR